MHEFPGQLQYFLESIHSKKTQEQYLYYLDNFVRYFKLRNKESIVTIQPTKLQEMIEDFIIGREKRFKEC